MDKRTKWSYCIGATGRDAAYALVSLYIMTYIQYTVKLTTLQYAIISIGMVVCMVWDAVNDLLMGIIIENSRLKMGKFRPWILLGSILSGGVIVCLFTIRPSGWAFVVFFLFAYLMWGMTFTMNDISYWGMLPSLSSDAKVRNSIVTIMSIFICIGQFAVAGIVPNVIAGNAVSAYRTVAIIVASAFILCQILVTWGVTERPRDEKKKAMSIKDMYKVFARNDQLVWIGVASLIFNIGCNLLNVFGINFFYVEFGYSSAGTLVTIFTAMYGVGMLVSQALYSTLCKKFTRMQILRTGIISITIGYILFFSFGYIIPKNAIILDCIGLLIFFFQGLFNLTIIVMINNTIEYDEYHHGERHDSVISAVRSFSVKLASGLNQGIMTLTLIVSGIYATCQNISELENAKGLGTMTEAEVLEKADTAISQITSGQGLVLRIFMVGVPMLAMLSCFFIIKKKYKIDEKEYDRLVAATGHKEET